MNENLEEFKKAAKEGTHEAMHELLEKFGFDVKHPREMQADQLFIRQQRKSHEAMTSRFKMILTGILTTAGVYALWEAIKQTIHIGK